MALSVMCPSCGKSFQLAQEIYDRKVAGKIVSIRCKQCQSGIRIDATQPGGLKVLGATPATAEPAGQGVRARQPTLIGMMGPGGAVTSKTSEEGALWAVDSAGTGEDRELDDATIAREIAAGTVGPTTLVWRDGMSDWLEVQQIPQLAKHLLVAKPAEASKVAAPLPAARTKQPSAPDVAASPPPVEPKRPVAAPAPAAAKPAPAAAKPAPAAAKPAPAAAKPAPAAPAPAPAARPAAAKADRGGLPGVPVMHDEEDEDEATMIFRTSAEAASKLGLGELPQEKTPVPAGPPPAAGRPTAGALGGAGAARTGAGKAAGSSPLAAGPRPGSSALGAGPGAAGRPAPRPGSSPIAAAPAAGSSPLAAAPAAPPAAAAAPAAPPAPPPPRAKQQSAPMFPRPEPAPAPLPAAAPPPPRAKQPSAPVLPRESAPPPEPPPAAPPPPPPPPKAASAPAAAPPPPPPPPSPPPPPAASAPVATSPAAPAPMRAKLPSASGLPRGLYPPPERPAPPPPSPPPAPPSTAPGFPSVQGGPQPMAQLAPNPFAVATTTDLEFTPQRSKTPFIVGGIVLVLAAAGIAVAVTSSGSHPAPPPVPPPAPAAPAPTTPPAAATETAPAAAVTTTPPTKPSDDIAGAPHPSATSGDFSQMFAAGAQQAQKGGTTSSAKAFDPEEARAAMAGVLKSVAACKEPGGPTGQTSASVTFDASGRVTSVTVGAPFSGTSTGTCIISAFKGVKVAPFNGLPGTVSQPVSLL